MFAVGVLDVGEELGYRKMLWKTGRNILKFELSRRLQLCDASPRIDALLFNDNPILIYWHIGRDGRIASLIL
jgi:hypothetical protein